MDIGGVIEGPPGEADTIEIRDTITLDPETKAAVIETRVGNHHVLDFLISRGEQGEQGEQGKKGEQGEKGDQGPTGPINEGSSEGILFASYAETNISGVMNVQESHIIPNNSEYFSFKDKTDIELAAGVYEIAFSGAIEEVDNSHGGIFYVKDDSGQVVMDLSFKLPGGSVSQMHFSQNVIFEFKNKVTLQVMAGIIGDAASSRVKINDVNLLLKKIYTK